ncbi:MAG: hypothetical protein Q8R67_20105 [Rhodoferax sp.]|nr:hypothetical protein [Rhodoferax sp.]MDP3653980.1 hypothetical protein [Rhodoferax sp.]
MSKLLWRVGSSGELAKLLRAATLEESAAVSGATVYRVQHESTEKIAIALPDGQALIIEPAATGRPRRRRQEVATTATAEPQSDDT